MFKKIFLGLLLFQLFSMALPASCEKHAKVILSQLSQAEWEHANVYMDCAARPAKSRIKYTSSFNASPIVLQTESYVAFVDGGPNKNWAHSSAWIAASILDESIVNESFNWETMVWRYNGMYPDEIRKCPPTLRLIHQAPKAEDWTVWCQNVGLKKLEFLCLK